MISITVGLARRLCSGGFFDRREARKELQEILARNVFESCTSEPSGITLQPGTHTLYSFANGYSTKRTVVIPEPAEPEQMMWFQIYPDGVPGVALCLPPHLEGPFEVPPKYGINGGGIRTKRFSVRPFDEFKCPDCGDEKR